MKITTNYKESCALRDAGLPQETINTQKSCTTCGAKKTLNEFHACKEGKYGRRSRCKACLRIQRAKRYAANVEREKAGNKAWYAANPEYSRARRNNPANASRLKARDAINNSIQSGKIIRPDSCARCPSTKHIEAHHPDYSKPLEVRWLCASCHQQLHWDQRRGIERHSLNWH